MTFSPRPSKAIPATCASESRSWDAGKFGLRGARRQVDDHPIQFAALDALEHLRHDVMVSAFDQSGPDGAHEGQEAPARFVRIAGIGAQEEVQMPGDLSALFGGEALIIEELCGILDSAPFAGSGSTHGAIIAK